MFARLALVRYGYVHHRKARLTVLLALAGLGVLLLGGLVIRSHVRLVRRLLLPVPVIAGFVGLAAGPYGLAVVPDAVVAVWARLPGLLINLVFAALFLGVTVPSAGTLVRLGGPLFRFGAFTALGQYAVAFLLTWWVLSPVFGTPDLFACLLEVGFAGGHGTAAAMAEVFDGLGLEAGGALGQMSATVGIVVAVVGGMLLAQWGVARGFAGQVRPDSRTGKLSMDVDAPGFVRPEARRPAAMGTVSTSVVDPLTFHLSIVLIAVLLGWLMQQAIRGLHTSVAGFPLFPLAMIGGMILQWAGQQTGVARHFDRATFQRIMGLSLDLLIVAAIASLRLDLFLANVAPFALLMVVGIVWTVGTFLILAPRMLPVDWFEQGITMYGTQTGVTAVGLMLLRIVDPDNETTAAQAFAARAMVSSPLIGGGLVTAAMPLLVRGWGLPTMLAATLVVMLVLLLWPTRRGRQG